MADDFNKLIIKKLSFSDDNKFSAPYVKPNLVSTSFWIGALILVFIVFFSSEFLNPINNKSTPSHPFYFSNTTTSLLPNASSYVNKSNFRQENHGECLDILPNEKAKHASLGGGEKILVNNSGGGEKMLVVNNFFGRCDNVFDGKWVMEDKKKPYYPAGSCPFIHKEFDCYRNGRMDENFLKWQWQPHGCNNILRLNATDFLERMRGKTVVFVGDSLNRNMWQSLVCILWNGINNKSRVFDVSGKSQYNKTGVYSIRFEEYDCFIDFVQAPFLVKKSSYFNARENRTMETLRLDLMNQFTPSDADVIVFNSWHWWNDFKTKKGENFYQVGKFLYQKLDMIEAYKMALTTWARWIATTLMSTEPRLFSEDIQLPISGSFSLRVSARGGKWNTGGKCHKETEPIMNETFIEKHASKLNVLENVLQGMKTPVLYLNISKLTYFRADGHPSIYRKEHKTDAEKIKAISSQDCNHWCLPGVPDTWNELMYSSLLETGKL